MSKRINWSLLGIPDHQGVIEVGGRIGAARGPAAFRLVFGRMSGRQGVQESLLDQGDLQGVGPDVAVNLSIAAERVDRAHSAAGLSVVVGGGHDHGFSHLKGVREALSRRLGRPARLGCINIDAHLDVRKPAPAITSGSPFYLAIEQGVIQPEHFVEFGIQDHCNAPALWSYVESRKIRVIPFKDLRHGSAPGIFDIELAALAAKCDAVAVSLDLDAAAAAFAPGVSAPQAEGFSGSEIVEMMELAGSRAEQAVSLGIFELNPEHDLDHRTARLAATAAWHFVAAAIRRA